MQRAMKRRIRGTKREIAAEGAGMAAADTPKLKAAFQDDYDCSSLKLTRQTTDYQKFCAENGLKTQWEGTQNTSGAHANRVKHDIISLPNADYDCEHQREYAEFFSHRKPDNGYGKRYEVRIQLTGENGKRANVKTRMAC